MENDRLLINPLIKIFEQIGVTGPDDYFLTQLTAAAVVWNYSVQLSKQITITSTQVNTTVMTVNDPNLVEFKASFETIGTISESLIYTEYRKMIDRCGLQIIGGLGVCVSLPNNI